MFVVKLGVDVLDFVVVDIFDCDLVWEVLNGCDVVVYSVVLVVIDLCEILWMLSMNMVGV